MQRNNLDALYRQVFKYIYPEIEDLSEGILYKVLHKILDNKPQEAEYICSTFTITNEATKYEDEQLIDDLISKIARAMSNPIPLIETYKRDIFWIVVVACLLAGAVGCIQYIQRKKNQEKTRNIRKVQQPVALPLQPLASQLQPVTAALCLVVPAYLVNSLKEQSQIEADVIEKLIDNASYFLCTKIADVELVQQSLDLTGDNILTIGERREVFVRIHIADGQEMIDKTVPYILKRNLPSHGQGVIRKIACLGDLSGLEAFNRV